MSEPDVVDLATAARLPARRGSSSALAESAQVLGLKRARLRHVVAVDLGRAVGFQLRRAQRTRRGVYVRGYAVGTGFPFPHHSVPTMNRVSLSPRFGTELTMATCRHLTRALSRAALAEHEVSRCGARIVGIDGLAGRTRRLTRPQARSSRPGGLDQPATSPGIAALASLGMAPGNRSGSARGKIANSRCEQCL